MSLPAGGSVIHPAITRVLERRPVLAWAYDNDPKMHEQVRQLNVVLLVLAKHMPDQWLADRVLDDPMLLPTDAVLEQRQLEMSRRLRDAIAELPPMTEDELRINLGIAPPVVSANEPCRPCAQQRHGECTIEVFPTDPTAATAVPCPCDHTGVGVLVVPPDLAQSIADAQEFRIDRVAIYQPSDDDTTPEGYDDGPDQGVHRYDGGL